MLRGCSSPKLTTFKFVGLNDEADIPEEMQTYAISSMLNRFQSLTHLAIELIWTGQWSPRGPIAAARKGEAIAHQAAQLKILAYRDERYMSIKELERPDTMMDSIKSCTNLEELALWIGSSLDIAGICKVSFHEPP